MVGDVEDRLMLLNTYLDVYDNKKGNCSYMLSNARIKSKLRGFKALKMTKMRPFTVRFLTDRDEK